MEDKEHHSDTSKDTEEVIDVESPKLTDKQKSKLARASQQKSFLCAIFFCLPLGIAAWVYSVKARDSLIRGEDLEHSKWQKKSNFFLRCAYQVGLLINIFFFGSILTAIVLLAVLLTAKPE